MWGVDCRLPERFDILNFATIKNTDGDVALEWTGFGHGAFFSYLRELQIPRNISPEFLTSRYIGTVL